MKVLGIEVHVLVTQTGDLCCCLDSFLKFSSSRGAVQFPGFLLKQFACILAGVFILLLFCHKVCFALIRLSSLDLNCPRERLDRPSPAGHLSSLLWATCGCPLPALEFPSPFSLNVFFFGASLDFLFAFIYNAIKEAVSGDCVAYKCIQKYVSLLLASGHLILGN